MRMLALAVVFSSVLLAPVFADGTKTDPAHHPAAKVELPPPQQSAVVSIERGVRVWRPITQPAEGEASYYPQQQAAGYAPGQVGYPAYGGGGIYSGFGNGVGTNGVRDEHTRYGSPLGLSKDKKVVAPMSDGKPAGHGGKGMEHGGKPVVMRGGHYGMPMAHGGKPMMMGPKPVYGGRPMMPAPKMVMRMPQRAPAMKAAAPMRTAHGAGGMRGGRKGGGHR
jgi:hypothetical protein